jgi:hypothetical protein
MIPPAQDGEMMRDQSATKKCQELLPTLAVGDYRQNNYGSQNENNGSGEVGHGNPLFNRTRPLSAIQVKRIEFGKFLQEKIAGGWPPVKFIAKQKWSRQPQPVKRFTNSK